MRGPNDLGSMASDQTVLRWVAELSSSGLWFSVRCECVVEDDFKQAAACVVAGSEALFQPVAERHQFIDLGDDAVLFGEGWESKSQIEQNRLIKVLHCCAYGCSTKILT